MKDLILKADNLYFSYEGDKNHSLNGLSLDIERGKKIAFILRMVPANPLFFSAATVY